MSMEIREGQYLHLPVGWSIVQWTHVVILEEAKRRWPEWSSDLSVRVWFHSDGEIFWQLCHRVADGMGWEILTSAPTSDGLLAKVRNE